MHLRARTTRLIIDLDSQFHLLNHNLPSPGFPSRGNRLTNRDGMINMSAWIMVVVFDFTPCSANVSG